jgi:hypothetical protein
MSADLRAALTDDLVALVADGIELDVDGFGRFAVRSYRTPGIAKLPYLSAASELRRWLEDPSGQRPSFGCAALAARTADRLGLPAADVAHVLDAWLGEAVERLRLSSSQGGARSVEPLWRLGLVHVRTKSPRVGAAVPSPGSARVSMGLVPSRALRAAVNRQPAPRILDSGLVAVILASYPRGGFTTADQLAAPFARLHRSRRAVAPGDAIEDTLKQPLPPLLKTLLAYDESLNLTLHGSVADTLAARKEHRALMDELGCAPGVPFAVEANGDSWCFCAHDTGTDDRWVFLAGPDAPSRHTHELRFGQWLAAGLLLRELERAASDAILAEPDLTTVLDYLRATAPSADTLLIDLPH